MSSLTVAFITKNNIPPSSPSIPLHKKPTQYVLYLKTLLQAAWKCWLEWRDVGVCFWALILLSGCVTLLTNSCKDRCTDSAGKVQGQISWCELTDYPTFKKHIWTSKFQIFLCAHLSQGNQALCLTEIHLITEEEIVYEAMKFSVFMWSTHSCCLNSGVSCGVPSWCSILCISAAVCEEEEKFEWGRDNCYSVLCIFDGNVFISLGRNRQFSKSKSGGLWFFFFNKQHYSYYFYAYHFGKPFRK